ncbi:MAG: PIG-L family deacetylase [Casimicrobiaceae bacterium]|nr:PIG-L family deacetylase [Casimicrobiaceae bacterium]MCX8098176.1 PIG-L family deacetylase [Casimicrobiaceae bacterium]MDW8312776.1 PIG-L family deacetylase [Burkholderiales bacterium]
MSTPSHYVARWVELLAHGQALRAPIEARPRAPRPAPGANAPTCMLLSPHPDDEAIQAALPLRLAREAGWHVLNCAVTFGSNRSRRRQRLAELQASCSVLGFALERLDPTEALGLDAVTTQTRDLDSERWDRHCERLRTALITHRPALVLAPHAEDAHPTHRGTHRLLVDVIARMAQADEPLPRWVALTEYWAPLATPNLLVEVDVDTAATMVEALACHWGEVERNPYHASLPAWLIDNRRRGSELIWGAGADMRTIGERTPFAVLLELFSIEGTNWQRWRPELASDALWAVSPEADASSKLPARLAAHA